MRIRVTDIRIAAHGGTSLSKNMGRDCNWENKTNLSQEKRTIFTIRGNRKMDQANRNEC